jgi:hypothetical protein
MTALGRSALASVLCTIGACAMPPADARFDAKVPGRDAFPIVAQVLVRHCGSLDCHGESHRNLRIYGNEGLRLAATDRPLSPECTTDAEVDQDYDSLVGLEPEVLSAVVADRGRHPERLTLIRKARGTEQHKGGTLMKTGDDTDVCLTSWLAGQVDDEACTRALPESTCF